MILGLFNFALSSSSSPSASKSVIHGQLRFRILTSEIYKSIFGHLVELLGRGTSPTQGLDLHRRPQHRKTHTHIHASNGIRALDHSVREVEYSTCLRPRVHWDWHYALWTEYIL